MQLHQLDARIRRILTELHTLSVRTCTKVQGIEIAPRGTDAFGPFENGGIWAIDQEWWDFRFHVVVPQGYRGRVVLSVRTGREAEWEATNPQFVSRVNGRIEQAFDTKHTAMTLQQAAAPGEQFDIILNGYSAIHPELPKNPPVLSVTLDDLDESLVQLIYDIEMPFQAAILLPEGERERETTLETLSSAIDLLDLRAPHSPAFDAAVRKARAYLAAEYYKKRAALPPVAIADAVGHTHIDVAWLWDLEQTRSKAIRSFSTVLKLMEQYPEYKFMSSQAQLYSTVKSDEPELFERIKAQIKAGRWEVEGGMWVEADCNLAGGESLVRQFLMGQQFFGREFSVHCRILWLPDVFGYCAALPQIMKLSGIDYFMTTKLSWSEFNLSPYDTFIWKGIDGSEILTHFSPSREFNDGSAVEGLRHFTTYNAFLTPSMMRGGWQRFQQKGLDNEFLVCFGYGDGGGGPTDWMLENGRRMETPLPGTPVVRQTHARPFFEALEKRVKDDPRLPKWSGELYLEYHRGTYTAMARNKRSNRKTELLLRDVELLCAQASLQKGFPYPIERLDALWQDALTLQFHDILPGSSIKKVYDDSQQMYERMTRELDEMKHAALRTLSCDARGDVLALNTLCHERADLIWFDAPDWAVSLKGEDGALYPVQFALGRACAFVRRMKPMGMTPYFFSREQCGPKPMKVTKSRFETPFFKGKFDKSMRIVSLIERSGREIVKKGEALGKIVCYENKPHNFDAWDINIYYDRRHYEVDRLESCELIACGPVLAVLRVRYSYMNSEVEQDITLYHDIGRIDYHTSVDFREQQYLLKAHFPVDVLYNEATYDIQYGNIKRATHKNTSWDVARFEVCAHKWADVSEDGFGVSLLNDCKYGHSVDEHSMALTLLKSSTHPNPVADQEVHHFTYSLMPHQGGWREADVPGMAYQLNVPVITTRGGGEESTMAFASADAPNIIIEAVKQAQDGQGTIVRLYECFGRRMLDAVLQLGFEFKHAEVCDLLERPLGAVTCDGQALHFELKPYEIKSFRIQ